MRVPKPSREYLLMLLNECGRCSCNFDCYCGRNAEWAERELAKMTRAKNAALTADGGKPCDTARVTTTDSLNQVECLKDVLSPLPYESR